jgi:RNA polymerase sigma-70 factor (ECF subfamily)
VVAVTDSGGQVVTTDRIRGAEQVANCVVELAGPDVVLTVEAVNGRPGVVLRTGGRVVAVLSPDVAGQKISTVWIVLNPDKLRHWPVRE